MVPNSPVWTLSTEQVYETLSTSAQGLSEAETAVRIKHYGFNELPEPAVRSIFLRFTDQLTHFMALLLWVAGTLAFVFASRGYRVLGVATQQKQEIQPQNTQELEQNLIFVGLVAMIDPPRPEVADAIAKCHQAGIQVTMVTGDYGLTAEAIARKIGLVNGKAKVVTGEDMGHLSDAQLRQILQQKSGLVFARVMPEQKLRLVQAYIAMGHIVAVTGDALLSGR
jgi:magnesium-transporting ATPase (P-type)